jgi:rubredoxin
VDKLEELDEPVIGEGPGGLPVLIYHEKVLFARASIFIEPNITNATTYFEAALFPTFYSDRCTDCHKLNTPELLAEHHVDAGAGFGNVEFFIEYTKLTLEPSAYVTGGHVMTCDNCHFVPTSHNGDPFHEVEWKTPYFDLDVNWYIKNAAQICSRVTANLPTPGIRHEHFHEDARLHWAIEDPQVMGFHLEPPAEPQDWDEFLARVDRWNQPGIDAHCP